MADELTKTQIGIISEKLMDWGNLVFIALAIGQFVPGSAPFRTTLFFLGVVGMIGAYATAYYLMKKRG
jgi:hypothetical protein